MQLIKIALVGGAHDKRTKKHFWGLFVGLAGLGLGLALGLQSVAPLYGNFLLSDQ